MIDLHGPGLGPQSRTNAEQLIPLADALFARPDLYQGPQGSGGLALFVAYLEALRGVGDSLEAVVIDTEQEAVKLMTVHSAKGLEFGTLFLPRLTERDFAPKATAKWDKPFPLVWHHDREFAANVESMLQEEERRLFYVAVTRARDRLFLSWAPIDPRRVRPMERSPFLVEVAEACDALELEPLEAGLGPGLDLSAVLGALVSTEPARGRSLTAHAPSPRPALPEVLSFSHLQTYQLCPYRFSLQYLLRVPGRPSHAADEGARVHAAIERLAAASGLVSYEQFSGWAAAPALTTDSDELRTETEPGYQPTTIDPLQAFWASEYAQVPPLASEQEFHLRLGPAVIRGFIDRLHPLPDGGVEVVDFKTYNRLMTEAQVKGGLQLPLYILGCREALGFPEARSGALFFLKHGKVVRVTYTEAELEAARGGALDLIDAIHAGKFDPTPGDACTFCPYRETCPVSTAI